MHRGLFRIVGEIVWKRDSSSPLLTDGASTSGSTVLPRETTLKEASDRRLRVDLDT